ncbi:MAG: DMT family transporter [Magnetovibrionaceae bacterium]
MTDHSKRTTKAILITILAGCLVAGMDAFGKALMADQPPLQVVWGRYFFHAVIMAAVLLRGGEWSILRPRKPKLQAFRAACLLGITISMYTALNVVPLADATAVLFFAPVLLTLLAGIFLKEPVGWRRLSAVAVGFSGVLLIVRPGFGPGSGNVAPELIFAFLAACFLAVYMLVTKQLSGKDDERTTLFYTTAPGALLLSLALPWIWADLTVQAWAMMLACGALGAGGHYLLVQAFHLEDAGTLSPFLNAHLVAAMVYSLVFFGDPLTPTFFAGTSLIVGSGLFIWWRERRKKAGMG